MATPISKINGAEISALSSSYAATSSYALLALTASYFENNGSTITGNSGFLNITTPRLFITGSNLVEIFGNSGVRIIGSITSQGGIRPSDPYTNSVSSYDLGSTSAAWRNIYTNNLTTLAGTNTIPPLKLTAGTNLSTPSAGAIEYDGTVIYSTNDVSSQRGYVPSTQIFRLAANGSSITTIANFFGPISSIQLAAGGVYEIEAYCYFAKLTTNSTVVVTITTSAAPVNLNAILQYGLLTNGGVAGAANQVALFSSTSTSATLTSGTLTAAQNHAFTLRLILDANASASNLRINFTSTAGSVTPYRNSYYKVTKLPSGNVGNFVA